ncbi:MBL fold metallo-hydrolase [Streptomyces endophyticus]|uniref:Cyclic nucleotide-binding domain-containing protein n=1 Tax=Streptomyces endophyticus TaxID=714166 RepID=A0ABU6FEV2_9ACTN|nr:hypothetical protein [Streptomyces endophyticus]MEB8342578.1 hypothetical protein [Streptomyces endophyticus]
MARRRQAMIVWKKRTLTPNVAPRVRIHDRNREIAPGTSVHLVGGQTARTHVVRVATGRGSALLASDADHFYADAVRRSVFSVTYDAGTLLDVYEHRFPELANGPDLLVLARYPALTPALNGMAMRLDTPPVDRP